MEQKFYQFEDALAKLGVSMDQLNALREGGVVRAYRDGSSWKFRAEDIERMVEEGLPELPPASDVGLSSLSGLLASNEEISLSDSDVELALDDADNTAEKVGPVAPGESGVDIELADLELDSTGSEIDLAAMEDTVTAPLSDISLDAPDEPSEPSDSILLSEEELGESVSPSLSTIIGRKDLPTEGADLELELADDVTDDDDTKLSMSGEGSDVLSSRVSSSGVLDDMEDLTDAKKKFEELEELEIDLAAESSLAISPSEFGEPKDGGKRPSILKEGGSDLSLDAGEEEEDDANMGSTDVPLGELATPMEPAGSGADFDLELAGDDDLILSEAGGSDITLDSGDSGINLVSPSDSGLALDDMPLDVGGSAILSSLSLEGSDPEYSLLGGDSVVGQTSSSELQTDDEFQLTPLSEGGLDDGDSSSQVIALDADLSEFGEGAARFDEGGFGADEGVVVSSDFEGAPGDELGVGYGPVGAVSASDKAFDVASMLLLASCSLFLVLAGIMTLDMVRNIWAWGENYSITSWTLEALCGLFGLT
jgi:hypothetical protein